MEFPLLTMSLPELIQAVGYLGVFLIVFIESGVPIGLFLPLPGDTLLFAAGLLSAGGTFDLFPIMGTIALAAVLGDNAGYWFGAKFGRKAFSKEDALFMNTRNLARTEAFYKKYGSRAIILARFLPIFRTLAPIAAGVAHMKYVTFMKFNIVGALVWTISVTLLGYYLGQLIPNVDRYLIPLVLCIAAISSFSLIREVLKARKEIDTPQ